MNNKTRKEIKMKRTVLEKREIEEQKRREEYYECLRQEQIKKEEALERSRKQLDRVFKFLDLEDEDIIQAISEKISSDYLKKILDSWLEGNMKEEKKGKDFLEAIAKNFTSSDLFAYFEKMQWYDKDDFQESFVVYLDKNCTLTFKADSLEKVIAFEKFTEEWKNK